MMVEDDDTDGWLAFSNDSDDPWSFNEINCSSSTWFFSITKISQSAPCQEDFAARLSKSMQFSDPADQDPYGFYEKAEAHTGFCYFQSEYPQLSICIYDWNHSCYC